MTKFPSTKAYTVSFTNDDPGPGRSRRAIYKSAVVIAVSPMDAGEKAERWRKLHFAKLHVEEIRLENDTVIIETDADGALA